LREEIAELEQEAAEWQALIDRQQAFCDAPSTASGDTTRP
jgi:hypothetical protein